MEKRTPNENASEDTINPYLRGDLGVDHKGRGGWAKHVPDRKAIMERAIPERMMNLNHGKLPRLLNSTALKYSLIHPYLTPGDRILDMCAGSGFGSMLMSRSGYKVTAVDYHTEILEYRLGIDVYNVDLLSEDLTSLGGFDAVTMIDCIEHFDLEGQVRIMEQARKALPEGATLLIDTPNSPVTEKKSREHLREMCWADFGSLVEDSGFEIMKRYYIEWVEDSFASLVESSEPAPDLKRVCDQVVVARKA